MITQAKKIEDEIISLASSIKKNMVEPAEQRMERLEARVSEAERAVHILSRGFLAAGVVIAATVAALIYHLILH